MDKEKINQMKAVISPCVLLARMAALCSWCTQDRTNASSACSPHAALLSNFPVQEG